MSVVTHHKGQLTQVEIQRRFNTHLRECGECRTALETPLTRQLCVVGQMLGTMLEQRMKERKK